MRRSEAGFSMIEALVAMTVLAVTAAGLLSAAEQTIRTSAALDDRVLLRWVAEDQIAAARAGLGPDPSVTVWGRQFEIETETRASSDPDTEYVSFNIASPQGGALTLGTYLMRGPRK